MAFTTADLLSSIERKSFAPANQSTFTSAEILAMADEVIEDTLVPELITAREDYFQAFEDQTLVANQNSYLVAARAIGQTLTEVSLLNDQQHIHDLPRVSVGHLASFGGTGTPEGYYLRGDEIVLYPTPASASHTLRVHFPIRPGKLVPVSEAAVITAIDTGTGVLTFSSIPSSWTTSNTFDLCRARGGQNYLGIDQAASAITSTTMTFASLPTHLSVGDYVSLAGESALVQMPQEWRAVLAQGVAVEILKNGGWPGLESAREKFDKGLERVIKLSTPRVLGDMKTFRSTAWD